MRFTQEREADAQQSLLDGTGAAIRVAAGWDCPTTPKSGSLSSGTVEEWSCPICAGLCLCFIQHLGSACFEGWRDSRKWLEQGEGVSSRFEVRFPAEPLGVESSDRGGGTARGRSGTSSCKPPLSGEPTHCWAGHLHCWAGNSSLLPAAGRHKGCAGGG